MIHSIKGPHKVESTTQPQTGHLATLTKVALIFEHSSHSVLEQTLDSLRHVLNPHTTEISLVHILPEQLSAISLPSNDIASLSQYLQEKEQYQQDAMATLREMMEKVGYVIAHEYTSSRQEQNIQPLIEQIHAFQKDLMVLCGSHLPGHDKLRNHFFMALATHVSVPVLVLKKYFSTNRTHFSVLFGVDDSESTMLAARKLASLIPAAEMEITLATVQSPIYQENAVLAPYVNQEILDESLANNAKIMFSMVNEFLEAEGVAAQHTKTLLGSPAAELSYLAELENPDLLVVGSHNRSGIMAWLMGSVSSQLLHWDTHNILVIR